MEPVILPPKLPDNPVVPRPSATLIVINEHNEILLVQRSSKSRDFHGATVFPGGNFDTKQDDSLGLTALRETFEETGLLLVCPADPSTTLSQLPSKRERDEAREAIYDGRTTFKQFLDKHALIPATKFLLPFSAWVTPPNYPKRFRTHFFVVFLQDVPSTSGFQEGKRQQYLLTPDKSEEVTAIKFMHPTLALRGFFDKKYSIPTPQAYNIITLSEILKTDSCTPEEQARVRQLSAGLYGGMTLHPLMLVGNGYKGRVVFTYEGDETRGGPFGQVHRSVDWMEGGSYISSDSLLRNFNIFDMKQEWLDNYHPKL